jgi:hypothetical protein
LNSVILALSRHMSYNYVSVEIKSVIRDGRRVVKSRCPLCGTWSDIDGDQLEGRASVVCQTASCTFRAHIRIR